MGGEADLATGSGRRSAPGGEAAPPSSRGGSSGGEGAPGRVLSAPARRVGAEGRGEVGGGASGRGGRSVDLGALDNGEVERQSVAVGDVVRRGWGAFLNARAPSRPRWSTRPLQVRIHASNESYLLNEVDVASVLVNAPGALPGVSWRRVLAVLAVTIAYISIGAAVFLAIDRPYMKNIGVGERRWCSELVDLCGPALEAAKNASIAGGLNSTQQAMLLSALSHGCPNVPLQGQKVVSWNCFIPPEERILAYDDEFNFSDGPGDNGDAQAWVSGHWWVSANPYSYTYNGVWLMSFLMIATIGYEGVRPFSNNAKIYASFYLAFGVPLYFFLLGVIAKGYERVEFVSRRPRREAARRCRDAVRNGVRLLFRFCRNVGDAQSGPERSPVTAPPSDRPPLLIHFVPCALAVSFANLCLLGGLDNLLRTEGDSECSFWNAVYLSFTSLLTVDAFFDGVVYNTPLQASPLLQWGRTIIYFVLIVLGMSILWFLVSCLIFGMDTVDGLVVNFTMDGLRSSSTSTHLSGSGEGVLLTSAPSPGEVLQWGMPSPESRTAPGSLPAS